MTAEPAAGPETTATARTEEHVVVFTLADEQYALDIHSVQEIVRMQKITSIPGADAWVEGVTTLRGTVVPVLDMRRRCGIGATEHNAETRIVVTAFDDELFGLIVDSVESVVRIPAAQVEPPNKLVSAAANRYLRGIAKLEEQIILLLDLQQLVPASSRASMRKVAAAA